MRVPTRVGVCEADEFPQRLYSPSLATEDSGLVRGSEPGGPTPIDCGGKESAESAPKRGRRKVFWAALGVLVLPGALYVGIGLSLCPQPMPPLLTPLRDKVELMQFEYFGPWQEGIFFYATYSLHVPEGEAVRAFAKATAPTKLDYSPYGPIVTFRSAGWEYEVCAGRATFATQGYAQRVRGEGWCTVEVRKVLPISGFNQLCGQFGLGYNSLFSNFTAREIRIVETNGKAMKAAVKAIEPSAKFEY